GSGGKPVASLFHPPSSEPDLQRFRLSGSPATGLELVACPDSRFDPVHSPALSVGSCGRRAMIELNPEQRQAMAQGQPVRIIDPETQDAYVLFRAVDYARLEGALPRPAGQPHPEIPPIVLRSEQAFWRDLPELL